MDYDLPTAGAANEEIAARAHQEWLDAARASGVILTGFDASLHLADRLAWAISAGLAIGAIYTRFSTKLQDSTADQIRACIIFAARALIASGSFSNPSEQPFSWYSKCRDSFAKLTKATNCSRTS